MGKFSKKASANSMEDINIDSSVDWQQLMANFQTLCVEDAMKSIMVKVRNL